jgi:CubicO group peptidase (beta-lactamase class C family)
METATDTTSASPGPLSSLTDGASESASGDDVSGATEGKAGVEANSTSLPPGIDAAKTGGRPEPAVPAAEVATSGADDAPRRATQEDRPEDSESLDPTEISPSIVRALAEADSLVEAAVAGELTPGAVLLVAAGRRVLHHRAYGHARAYDYRRERRIDPEVMTREHVFDLASLTKVFGTTLAVMRLVDQHLVDLDAPVRVYVPEFAGASKDSVTVRHLLAHTAGLFPWKPVYYHGRSSNAALEYVTSLPLAFPVGGRRAYSDLGFMLLGRIVEDRTGRTLDEYLRTEFYDPMGLENTAFRPISAGLGPFASTSHGNPYEKRMVSDPDFGYLVDEDPGAFDDWREYVLEGEVNDGNAYYAFEGVAGHAGLFSTTSDLLVLSRLLLWGGAHRDRSYIDQKVIQTFLTPDEDGNGLGWIVSNDLLRVSGLPAGSFGHTGFTGTYALVVPDYELIVILLANRQNLDVNSRGTYNNLNPLRRQVAEALVGAFARG